LLPGVGSVVPLGTVIVAVFTNEPVAEALRFAVNVYVAVAPTAKFTVSEMFPVPLAAHVAPDDATHDHVAPLNVPGSESATVAPTTFDGPLFEATITYVTGEPGVAVADESVFVIDKSAFGLSVSVSVAELLPGVGSVVPLGTVIVAVFANEPVDAAETAAVSVYVTVAPTAKFTVSEMLPVPLAVQLAPELATHVHVAPLNEAGSESATIAPTTFEGPAFVATIVYVTVWPGVAEADESVLVIWRSAFGESVSVSVAELLPGVGSVVPLGTVTVAVFANEPVAFAATVAVSV
jgi:hypothetical protein